MDTYCVSECTSSSSSAAITALSVSCDDTFWPTSAFSAPVARTADLPMHPKTSEASPTTPSSLTETRKAAFTSAWALLLRSAWYVIVRCGTSWHGTRVDCNARYSPSSATLTHTRFQSHNPRPDTTSQPHTHKHAHTYTRTHTHIALETT